MNGVVLVLLGFLGLCLGSFINALVWRLHEQAAIRDKIKNQPTKKQRTKLDQLSISKGRSMCTSCQHILAWYDLIPVLSWLSLGGRCRYCSQPVSVQYPAVELATAGAFILSYLLWPFAMDEMISWVLLGLWLVMAVILMALFVYDTRWRLLPNKLTYPLIVLALIYGLIRTLGVEGLGLGPAVWQLVLGALSVGGLYYALYSMSGGRWVGGGDAKLGYAMGLILGWQGGLLAVFLANLIGMIYILPGLMTTRLSTKSHIPFGPFLIIALFIALLFGGQIINWYLEDILML